MAQILIYGYSNIGKAIAGNLKMPKEEIIIADSSPSACKEATQDGFKAYETTLRYDNEFHNLGIGTTITHLFCVHDYIDLNIFITLTARMMDANLFILATAENTNQRTKLMLAGASETIDFEASISYKIACMLTDRKAFEVYEGIFYNSNNFFTKNNITMEEIAISKDTILEKMRISDINFNLYNIIALGFYSQANGFLYNIDNGEYTLCVNDVIMAIGKKEDLKKFGDLAAKAQGVI